MNAIKATTWISISGGHTGIVERDNGSKTWFKNGKRHREDGPAHVESNGYKMWYLEGKIIWGSDIKLDLTNEIVLSKFKHPEYPIVQVWKILDKDKVYEQFIIPGMEEFIIE